MATEPSGTFHCPWPRTDWEKHDQEGSLVPGGSSVIREKERWEGLMELTARAIMKSSPAQLSSTQQDGWGRGLVLPSLGCAFECQSNL